MLPEQIKEQVGRMLGLVSVIHNAMKDFGAKVEHCNEFIEAFRTMTEDIHDKFEEKNNEKIISIEPFLPKKSVWDETDNTRQE